MTYAFGRLHGLGTLPWHLNEVTGAMMGNPSVSDIVSSYMVSLRRRKVRAGETQTSARAITEVFLDYFFFSLLLTLSILQDILKKIYDVNHQPEHWDLKPVMFYRKRKGKNANTWGGGRARRLLHAAYVLSFLCLLRVDEVLKIEMHHIEFISDTKIKLTLPFRKTHQFGRKPGILY